MWRRHGISAFLKLPEVVSCSSEKCPSLEGLGVGWVGLRSRDLFEPKVNLVGGLCLAQGGLGRVAGGAVSCCLLVPLLLLLTEETSAFRCAKDVFSTQCVFENV